MKIAVSVFVLFFLSCQRLPVRPLPPEASVSFHSIEPRESKKRLHDQVNYLREIYRQAMLVDNATSRWTENCLQRTSIPNVEIKDGQIIHVSKLMTRGSAPGYCAFDVGSESTILAHIYCEGDAHFLKIYCPADKCSEFNWKTLCY